VYQKKQLSARIEGCCRNVKVVGSVKVVFQQEVIQEQQEAARRSKCCKEKRK
jgi:hypothetical protein